MQEEPVSDVGGEAAGFGVRLVASLIDGIIMIIPHVGARLLLGPALGTLFGAGVSMAYTVYFWTYFGATPGKMAMGLKVVSAETGRPIGVSTAILRYVGYLISGIPLFLGYLWVLWDPEKQAWHDKIAKTRVIE